VKFDKLLHHALIEQFIELHKSLPCFCSGKGEDQLAVKNTVYNKFVAKLFRR